MAKLLSILLLVSTIVVPAHAATIYKWKDKEGQTHYTRTPPPKSMTSEKVESKDAEKIPAARVEEASVVKEPAKQAPTTPVITAEAKRRQEMCQSAQQDLNEMRQSDKVKEHGHLIEITEDERLRRIDELNNLVKELCTPRKPQPAPQPVQQPAPQELQKPVPQSTQKPVLQPSPQSTPQVLKQPAPRPIQQPAQQLPQKSTSQPIQQLAPQEPQRSVPQTQPKMEKDPEQKINSPQTQSSQ